MGMHFVSNIYISNLEDFIIVCRMLPVSHLLRQSCGGFREQTMASQPSQVGWLVGFGLFVFSEMLFFPFLLFVGAEQYSQSCLK